MQELVGLLRQRTGGQVNIRGLSYQLLYALRRALEMLRPGCAFTAVGLERFEDVDLYGDGAQTVKIESGSSDGLGGGNVYLQAKTCDGRWVWSNLQKPVKSFLETLRADPEGQFWLVLNFALDGDPLDLANLNTLSVKRRRALTKQFQQLCQHKKVGGTQAEADDLLPRLHLVTIPEEQLLREARQVLAEAFELHGAGVDRYLSIFFERFLFWSRERKVVRREDLTRLRDSIAQDFALETAYDAFGRGLLQRADWEADARPDDFFEGKETRAGHVGAGLDVPRPLWIERIEVAMGSASVVVVRAPSGQGKSTLALRYARDKWPQQDTFVLKTAQTPAEVEMVCSVLRHRSRTLGLPTYLLLDNAGRQTQLWPRVAQECLALGIPVLATLRQEDWYRFARTHRFSYEPIEPSLQQDEAKQIYSVLHGRGRIHPSVEGAEWAYEKIGEPHLLMEYVYLLTYGRMLEDRLRDQIADIDEYENSGKLEVLRRVALADALSAPVLTDRLCDDVARQPGFTGDARQLVRSLEDEYLKRHGERLAGLHWVRSDHLVRLLHDDPAHLADTTLAVLGAVPFEHLPDVVSNALCRADLNGGRFMIGLTERARRAASEGDTATLLALVEGVYEAGERRFLDANRAPFDEARGHFGQAGPLLLMHEGAPAVRQKFLDTFRAEADRWGEGLVKIAALGDQLSGGSRGRDAVREFLSAVVPHLQVDAVLTSAGDTGSLLAWCGWCGVTCSAYEAAEEEVLERVAKLEIEVAELQKFAEGLWLYNRDSYRRWLDSDPQQLNGYLRWQLDCLNLQRDLVSGPLEEGAGAQGELSIEFFVESDPKPNTQAVDRLQVLYSLFPFYERYRSQGIWELPSDAPLGHDPSIKAMTQEFQYLRFLVARNQVWTHVVESAYALDNFYLYQRAWHDLRSAGLEFLALLSRRLRAIVTRERQDFRGAFLGDILDRLENLLTQVPDPPSQTPDDLKPTLKPAEEWATHWQNFRRFVLETAVYFTSHGALAKEGEGVPEEEQDTAHTQHLAWHNFGEVCEKLPKMQEAMRALFAATSDYFGSASLEATERQVYAEAAELLDVWLKHPLPPGVRRIEAHVATRREKERHELLDRLHQALAPLEATGMTFLYPRNIIHDFPLTMLPLGFSVDDPCNVESERNRVLSVLLGFEEDVTYFWLIPTYQEARFIEGGFHAPSRWPDHDDEAAWQRQAWTLNVQPVPEVVWSELPQLPTRTSPRLELFATLHNLISRIEPFLRTRQIIEELRVSGDPYDAKLYEKHKARVLHEHMTMQLDYTQRRATLEEEFGSRRDEPGFVCAVFLLDLSERLGSKEAWEELEQPVDFSPQALRQVINDTMLRPSGAS